MAIAAADPAVLAAIARPGAALAVWLRTLPEAWSAPLAALAARPFCAEAEAPPDAAPDALAPLLPQPLPAAVLDDLRRIAVLFALVARTPARIRLRLEAIDGPACHRWHADSVGLRLLTTYHGAGTEWLAQGGGAAMARRLGPRVRGQRLAAGAVALLKGEAFPGNAGRGCIHRSPQDAGPRLLFCCDEPGGIPLA
jgi:hypothetical protein